MRLHSAITLRNLLARKSLRIPQNLSVTINSLGDVSGNLGPSLPSHYSKSSHSEASFSSLIFRIPNASSTLENQRRFSTDSSGGGSPIDVNKVVDEINLKFAEAREEIEMAMDAKETIYFNEEAECARTAVTEVLEMFQGLLGKVTEKEKASLQRSMGLKMEQLKAELQQLNED
ncbi:Embryogenesis-like protein [Cardamine amara subsp. amara]|uniref:Embryogenesis-like protein n=1 Tax=Cardamine amara subsp. amara TaxID=228776 RepID=A0ABD1B0F1_CARAN